MKLQPTLLAQAMAVDQILHLVTPKPLAAVVSEKQARQTRISCLYVEIPSESSKTPRTVSFELGNGLATFENYGAVDDVVEMPLLFTFDRDRPLSHAAMNELHCFHVTWGDYQLQLAVKLVATLNYREGSVMVASDEVYLHELRKRDTYVSICLDFGVGKAIADLFRSSRLVAFDLHVTSAPPTPANDSTLVKQWP